jgi:ubiquinone/menaquinone biosynthesis C-methylase UbiE
MSIFEDPRREKQERPSTYLVQDWSNQDELIRLDLQDRLTTKSMGGVLPEQPDPVSYQRVLDVGSGPGWWLIEAAKAYPGISSLTGLDNSEHMVEYARAQAEKEQVSDRVHFQVGDALRALDFPANYFDLISQRYGASFIRKWDWSKLLTEYLRVCQPGGVIRITEGSPASTNSPSLMRLYELLFQAMGRAGNAFTPTRDGVINGIPQMLSQVGIDQIQTKKYVVTVQHDTPEKQIFIEDMERMFRTMVPFMRKWTKLPDDYDQLYQQMLQDMQQPDFEETTILITVWGTKRDRLPRTRKS